MPHAAEAERRAVTEQRLHQDVTARAWAREAEWGQVRARQAAAKARAEAEAAQSAAVPAAPMASVVVAPGRAMGDALLFGTMAPLANPVFMKATPTAHG
ncbi:hypothetical protein [Streptomyces barringtoniae]|uniref:hypothetical protein n=1 Tax=Streptomyces barringtoniae TaxID=2892029 RepID=UPI001E28EB3B|nr:hypothetical protein [Streptomyces barringtoniae]MCC5480470.1 hypothetical protein [Streptomyces barringtoniae]